jgi:methylmalonyl-CoA/ethylmalonyl-CoA epimerase
MADSIENKADYTPTRKPRFTGTMQIGLVVRDLDASLRRFSDDYGIGPWSIFEVGPENTPDLRHDGGPVKGRVRSAAAMIGGVWWELTEPLDGDGLFASFLAERGEGVHHIAVATPEFDALTAEHQADGPLPLSGSFMGIDVAYLPTDREFGVIVEIFKGMPGDGNTQDESEKS